MPGKKRFLLGGIGALLPILLSIAIADAARIGEYIADQPYELLGYVIRTATLFALGGVWAYVQSSEMQPLKVAAWRGCTGYADSDGERSKCG